MWPSVLCPVVSNARWTCITFFNEETAESKQSATSVAGMLLVDDDYSFCRIFYVLLLFITGHVFDYYTAVCLLHCQR